jgi:hypothetical protein
MALEEAVVATRFGLCEWRPTAWDILVVDVTAQTYAGWYLRPSRYCLPMRLPRLKLES